MDLMDFESKGKEKKKRKTIEFEGMRRSRAAEEYEKCRIQILPRDIVMDILSRLSIYSLFQCTLVSKEWRDIITCDSHFATIQHNRALKNKNNILSLLFRSDLRTFELVERGGLKHRKVTVMNANLTRPYMDYPHIGSCNGLLCLFSVYHVSPQTQIYVCNPITRESVWHPKLSIFAAKASGFGFDYATNKYKVVQVFRNCAGVLVAKIYTLGTEAWRQIESVPNALNALLLRMSDFLINGSLHWCCHKYVPNTILSLDMSKEQFGTVPAPKLKAPPLSIYMEVMAWKGHLSLVRFMASNSIQIWVMKEYNVEPSWTQLFHLTRPPSESPWTPLFHLIEPRRLESCFQHICRWPSDDESELDAEVLELLAKNFRFVSGAFSMRKVVPHIGSLVSLKTITRKVDRMEFSRSSLGSSSASCC